MIPAAEMAAQRRATDAFIRADVESVTLVPRERSRTASGGATYTDLPPRPSQAMRLIPAKETLAVERETLDGRIVKPEYVLLALWDGEMERGDRFSLGGNRYEVAFVHEKRDYQVKGEVVYLASEA